MLGLLGFRAHEAPPVGNPAHSVLQEPQELNNGLQNPVLQNTKRKPSNLALDPKFNTFLARYLPGHTAKIIAKNDPQSSVNPEHRDC